jgi:hypothetical protein
MGEEEEEGEEGFHDIHLQYPRIVVSILSCGYVHVFIKTRIAGMA